MPNKDELTMLLGSRELAELVSTTYLLGSWVNVKVIDYLAKNRTPATQSEIAKSLNIDLKDVIVALEDLSRAGLVRVTRSGNARKLWHINSSEGFAVKIGPDGIKYTHETQAQLQDGAATNNTKLTPSDKPKQGEEKSYQKPDVNFGISRFSFWVIVSVVITTMIVSVISLFIALLKL